MAKKAKKKTKRAKAKKITTGLTVDEWDDKFFTDYLTEPRVARNFKKTKHSRPFSVVTRAEFEIMVREAMQRSVAKIFGEMLEKPKPRKKKAKRSSN